MTPTTRPSPVATPSPSPDPTPGTAIVPGTVDRSSLEVSAVYDVDLEVTVGTGAVAVVVSIEARNESGGPIDRLELNTIAARLGGLEITAATVDDRPVAVTIDDQTLLVPLGGILPDGASTTVRLGYTATLRPDLRGSNWLFSRTGGTLALYRWIPWVSRAVPFDRPNYGDPFVTPSSPLVRVRVTTDIPMILASPGAEPVVDGLTWTFDARNVRDVSIVLAPDFRVTTGDADGIAVRAYTRPGGLDADRLVVQASGALAQMASRLGLPYPWPAYTIVETPGGYGMESPGLIWIPSGVASASIPYLVAHETAHQWFYGLVGNDQQAEPFADEAAADLLARTVLGTLRGSRCEAAPLDRSIARYSRACYYEVIYIQGGNVLDDVRAAMGTDRFWAALRAYLDANRFGLAGTRQLLEALRAASPVDLLPTLRARFPSLY
ncbi:MAG: hypothetical protein C0498_11445 [Anaerolinea sp.]|nr:hypothetical protein [Anaerolinea sp.]